MIVSSFKFQVSSLWLALLLAGCSVVSGRRAPDGTITVSSYRCLWRSEAVRVSTSYADFALGLSVGRTESDAAAVGAVSQGAVKGFTRP